MVTVLLWDGSAVLTLPSGWVEARRDVSGSAPKCTQVVAYKVAGASEPSTYSFTFSQATDVAFISLALSGVSATSPIDVTGGSTATTGSTITAPSVTTTVDNTWVLVALGIRESTTVSTPPGTTSRQAVESRFDVSASMRVADFTMPTAGASGAKSGTAGKSTLWIGQQVALRPANVPPNAPIPTSPADGATANRLNPIELKATFSDPDPGDSPSASKWRYKLTTASTWTTVEQGNPLQSYSIPAGLAAGNYEWQAAYADQAGAWGPFSSSAFFTAADPPPGPTWLDPIDGQTITSASHPGQISVADLDKSEWTLYADNAGVIDTTTVLQGPVLKTTGDLRTHEFTGLANNTPVWWSVRIEDGGLWTSPVQIRTPVAFTPPPTPTLLVAKSDAEGLVSVAVTNPAGEPDAAYNDIYCRTADHSAVTDPHRPYSETGTRIAALKPVNSTFLDWKPAGGVAYEYRVVAVAANGTISDSGWVPLDPAAEPTIYYGGGY